MSPSTQQMGFVSAFNQTASSDEAALQLASDLEGPLVGPVDLLLLFVTPHHADRLGAFRDRLTATLKPRVTLGLTVQGVIGVRKEIESGPGVSALAASLPGVGLEAFAGAEPDWTAMINDPEGMGKTLQVDGENPKAFILLADPFSTPVGSILPAMSYALQGAPIIGGLASGGRRHGENRLLLNETIHTAGALGLSIAGPILAQTTVSQGCRPIGRPLVITRSQRHVVQQLGGRNAVAVLRELIESLPPDDQVLIASHGLLVGRVVSEYRERFGRGDFLIRNIVGVDQNEGYLAIGDPFLRTGQTIQFHVRDQQTAREDIEMLLDAQRLQGAAAGGLLFTCNGRGSHLFDAPDPDAVAVASALGDMPLAGFFAAGEIGPVGPQSHLHGHTASLVTFRSPHAAPDGPAA